MFSQKKRKKYFLHFHEFNSQLARYFWHLSSSKTSFLCESEHEKWKKYLWNFKSAINFNKFSILAKKRSQKRKMRLKKIVKNIWKCSLFSLFLILFFMGLLIINLSTFHYCKYFWEIVADVKLPSLINSSKCHKPLPNHAWSRKERYIFELLPQSLKEWGHLYARRLFH